MNNSIEQMLEPYEPHTLSDRKNALKEVIQEIVLCGLSRAGFFDRAAFYGGTALRIFYGLDRFSEDLDFSLITADLSFDIAAYFPTLEKEVRSFGLNVNITAKEKSKESTIKSAFLKGDTQEHLLLFYPNTSVDGVPEGEQVKIKLEVDTNPPEYAGYRRHYRLLPVPYEIRLYDEPSLFAGKIHAVLCRNWKNRVKGRDLYDYIFYLSRSVSVNLEHLRSRMLQTGAIAENELMTLEELHDRLCNRFDLIDFSSAKKDVEPFLNEIRPLDLWSADFFNQIAGSLK